jgi:hypothetical protein
MSTKSPQDQQLDELMEIKKIIEKEIHKPFWRKALSEFASGLIRGVGLMIGTTIIAAMIIYALQTIIDWGFVQTSITDWIGQTAQDSVENAMPDISQFLR